MLYTFEEAIVGIHDGKLSDDKYRKVMLIAAKTLLERNIALTEEMEMVLAEDEARKIRDASVRGVERNRKGL